MRKIDIHCHTTKSQLNNIVPPSATIATIEKEMARYDIEYTVLLASYFPEQGKGVSNYRLLHWLQNKPAFCLFGSLDFETYFKAGFAELKELAATGYLRGIKIYSGYQKVNYGSVEFQKIAHLAATYELPLMFHGGYLQGYEEDDSLAVMPQTFINVARDFPNIPLIISHLAWPHVDALIEVMSQFDNILTDTSGMLDSYKTKNTFSQCVDALQKFLKILGPQRLLFGTDFPVQTHADSVQLIECAMQGYPQKALQDVYYLNAATLLKLPMVYP